jgi:hypothetical protein
MPKHLARFAALALVCPLLAALSPPAVSAAPRDKATGIENTVCRAENRFFDGARPRQRRPRQQQPPQPQQQRPIRSSSRPAL